MSRLISDPFTYNATKEFIGPLGIVNAPGNALAIAVKNRSLKCHSNYEASL
jgi:hypothetical protein